MSGCNLPLIYTHISAYIANSLRPFCVLPFPVRSWLSDPRHHSFLLSIFSSPVIWCTHLLPSPFHLISIGSGVIEMYYVWPCVYMHTNS